MKEYDKYFIALGESLGLAIQPGEDGACMVAVDESLPVVVRANEAAQRMELTAALAPELPEGAAWSDIMDMLNIALGPLFDQPGIGRDPESGAIVLYALLPLSVCSPAELAEAVPQFPDLSRALSARLAALDAG